MRVSLALLAGLTVGVGADVTMKTAAKAALGTANHMSGVPTKDAKHFMRHAGLGGKRKKEGGPSEGSQKVKKKPSRSLNLDDDDDYWDDDYDDDDEDWFDYKRHVPSMWGPGPMVVVAITVIGAILVTLCTYGVKCRICPACCKCIYRRSCDKVRPAITLNCPTPSFSCKQATTAPVA